jgi:hypothetical protein
MPVTGDQHTKDSLSVTMQCIKRANNMRSLSPMEDGPMKSPKKTAGQKPHYLAREEVGRFCEEMGQRKQLLVGR